MSEGGGSAGPDIGPNYQNSGPPSYSNPPSQPPTPSSTVQDPPNYQNADVSENSNDSKPNITNLHSNSASGLPPFSSFAASDVTEGLGGRLAGDGYLTSDGISSTRVMELSGWDYCYTDGLSGRYLERGDSMPVMIPQPQYRPWESKQDGSTDSIKSTLPSFQSQFGEELVTTLTTLTPAACSPAPSVPSPSLPSFHTLSAVNPRYPLVPAPVQAREIPSIQQQFLDERHIHLFQGPPGQNFTLQPQNGLNGQTLTSLNNGTTLTTLNNAQYHPQIINNAQILPSGQILAPQSHILAPSSQIITSNGHIITSSGGQGLTVVSQNSTPTVLTVVKTEPVNIVELKSSSTEPSNLTQLHHTNFQNPLITQGQQMDSKFGLESPPRGIDGRKKERRKIRASSLESSNESDGALSVESSGQVAAVSSTAGFKSPMTPGQMNNEGDGMITDTGEKQTKKKRKRCGECIGCQRKDNCGDCAPCRNDKSHQICKMRRCEKLTEKKHLLAYNREDGGVSYRGRGRGRGRGSRGGYRGKGARPGTQTAQVTSVVGEMNSAPGLVVGSTRESVKVDGGRVSSGPVPANPALAPTMAVPFYAGTEVWSASTPADPWTNQGQFIHQIDDIRYQHYPGYQTTGYQQAGFITEQTSAFQPQYPNTTNGNPATSPAQGNVTPRSTGSYTQVHTPTPSPNPSTPHVNGHRNGINVHYVEDNYVNGTTFNTDSSMVPPASTTPNSRSSSVHLEASETNSKTSGYMSGNEIPGYPLNSPQCQSSCNSSGYPGQSVQSEYGDQSAKGNSYQTSNGTNHVTQKSPSYTQSSNGTYQNYQNYNQVNAEEHQKVIKSSISPGSCHPSQKPSGMYPQSSPKSYSSNPSPQTYQEISPGHSRNAVLYENQTMGNGNVYQNERFDQQNYPIPSPSSQNYGQSSPSNSNQDKSNVNARIKSMIMSKHQMSQNQQQNVPNNNFSVSNENHMMSPHREMMSPGQHNVQMMSPLHHNSQMMSPMQNTNQLMSPNRQNNQQISSNQMTSPNAMDSKTYAEKIPQSDYGEKKQVQMNENTNHFLAFSHHLREGRVLQPEGGGVQNWTGRVPPRSNYHQFGIKSNFYEPLEVVNKSKKCKKKNESIPLPTGNFMKFPSVDFEKRKPFVGFETTDSNESYISKCLDDYQKADDSKFKHFCDVPDPIRNLEVNFPTKRNNTMGNTLAAASFKTESLENIRNFREQNFLPDLQNMVNSSWKLGKSFYSDALKQENSPESGLCKLQSGFSYQQSISGFQSSKSAYPDNFKYCGSEIKNPDYSNHGIDYDCAKYGKETVKLESPSEDTNSSNMGDDYLKMKMECQYFKSDCLGMKTQFVTSPTTKVEYPRENLESNSNLEVESKNFLDRTEENLGDSLYQRVSYAPNVKNMKVIDRRFQKTDSEDKTKWEEYQKERGKLENNGDAETKGKENYLFQGDGGPIILGNSTGAWCCRLGGTETPTAEHIKDGGCQGFQTADEFPPEKDKAETAGMINGSKSENFLNTSSQSCNGSFEKINCKSPGPGPDGCKDFQDNVERLRNNLRTDVPDCQCFPPDKFPPEPGSYYTHLGAAASLSDLRKDVEKRTGQTGKALRIEKICYTGKEGKTTQGCPLAKWVIRRSGLDEKFLIVVKHRQGHSCSTAWIVVCLVAWEGVPTSEADKIYALLSHKLNRFGLPTTRRCATNEPRTCACQGLDPDTCGASFSFGCSWSMYYNGCKYARSKTVRKFRLSVRSEEQEVEERMHVLATLLSPLYNTLAPDAFHNQTLFEREATECRLGFKPGRPFSGVTACIDFCAHSHRDLHNMNNGCTVVVTLTKHRSLAKPDDEQLHVLPLYIMDQTDEFGCKESQEAKYKNGSIECLNKFPCEVRVRAVPLQPCRRHGKKRKEEDPDAIIDGGKFKDTNPKNSSPMGGNNSSSPLQSVDMQSMIDGLDLQLQSSQVSSTVMDSPVGMCQGWGYQNLSDTEVYSGDGRWNRSWVAADAQRKQSWLNSNQVPPHWEYSGFATEKDVNPDSTTNQLQARSPICGRSASSGSSCLNSYEQCNSLLLSPQYHHQGFQMRNQIHDTNEIRSPHFQPRGDQKSLEKTGNHDEEKEEFRSRNVKISPQTSLKQWPEYSTISSPTRQSSSSFRIPRGRPPSNHNAGSISEQSETFLKPLPKDSNENVFNFTFNSTTEADLENVKGHWSAKPMVAEGGECTFSVHNSPNSNAHKFSSVQAYQCQKNNFLNSQFGNHNHKNHNSEQRQCLQRNWLKYSDNRCNDRFSEYHQGFNFPDVPPVPRWEAPYGDLCGSNSFFPVTPDTPKSEPIGEVTDFIENEECFKDSQMGGVAIALGHGSVLFECAKHELHATTALKKPNRLHPTRISLVFYQHRNLNRAKHGWDEWEEKMRLRKLGISTTPEKSLSKKCPDEPNTDFLKLAGLHKPLGIGERILLKIPTYTTTTWTTLFPMRPCMVTGPYQEGGTD